MELDGVHHGFYRGSVAVRLSPVICWRPGPPQSPTSRLSALCSEGAHDGTWGGQPPHSGRTQVKKKKNYNPETQKINQQEDLRQPYGEGYETLQLLYSQVQLCMCIRFFGPHCIKVVLTSFVRVFYLFQESSYPADSSSGHDVGTGRLPELRLITDALPQWWALWCASCARRVLTETCSICFPGSYLLD